MCVLVNVAFITLLERKILGYSQLRKGPNKVGLIGFVQPFNDAIKLFSKESFKPRVATPGVYLISPAIAMALSLLILLSLPLIRINFSVGLSILFIFIVIRINVYPTLLSGWSSNRKYAIVGALRAVAQTISYEVRLALILLFFIITSSSVSFVEVINQNLFFSKLVLFIPLPAIWLISCLAETNRTPFDFAEGESELVSGFNIEYGSVGFALIFMAEYARILFMSILFTFLFMSGSSHLLLRYALITIIVFFWVWIRTTLPRYRYDMLINLCWKVYLPMTLLLVFCSLASLN